MRANLNLRVDGIRSKFIESFPNSQWTEAGDVLDCKEDPELALDLMIELAESNPNVKGIISVGGWPMDVADRNRWIQFVQKNPDLLLVVSDAVTEQLALLSEGHVDYLVGQKPKDMGRRALDALAGILTGTTDPAEIIYIGNEIHVNTNNAAVGVTKSNSAGLLGASSLLTTGAAVFLTGCAL